MTDRDDFRADPVQPRTPRFCPRCRRAGPDEATLCPECGDAMAVRGYCGVCDRFWPLGVGANCPKHEIPLDDPPLAGPDVSDGEFTDWVSIAAYAQPIAAEVPRIRLEAEGIPTFLEGERMGGHGLYSVATGGVRLQVPGDLANEARIVLAQTWSPPGEPDDDLDDAWDDLAPEPGARRRAIMKAIIVVMLLFPAIRLLFALLAGG